MAHPENYTMTVYQGQTWELVITVMESDGETPKDLSTYSARMHVREEVGSDATIIELTTTNGRLSVRAPASGGVLDLEVSPTDTAALPCDHEVQTWVYDLEIYKTGDVIRVLQGQVIVYPEITR
jgi:hypothetical protein